MQTQFFIKVIISALIIAFVSELAKRNTFMGAIIASWPIISILTIIWLYIETRNADIIITLSKDLFWLTIPGIAFFLFLPLLMRSGICFAYSIMGSLLMTAGVYGLFMLVKTKLL